ncbi:hypothetical protein Syun_013841 [Stephania yunnanensis]|uniref:Uncharacterized protein n=1 Tax=Stephania yunnanensis TaxID=152371 RepID=A0AAP0JI63_9MAGN
MFTAAPVATIMFPISPVATVLVTTALVATIYSFTSKSCIVQIMTINVYANN